LALTACIAQSKAANKNKNKDMNAHTISATEIGKAAHFPPKKTQTLIA
jgi:hypothetical protein